MKTGYEQYFESKRKGTQVTSSAQQPVQSSIKTSRDVVQELRKQLQLKKSGKKKSIPWRTAAFAFIGILIAGFGLLNVEKLESVVSRLEISVLGSAMAQDQTAAPAEVAKVEEKKNISLSSLNVEETEYYKKLNERKKELDAREEELSRIEAELAAQREALDKRLVELTSTRREIASVLEEKVQTDDKKVDSLVQMYSNMKPAQAAKVFENMDEALAVEILGRMKRKNAAEIMNLIKAEKAQVFSEKYAGYKK